MIDYLIELGNWVWGWYGDPNNQNRSNALITAAGFLFLVVGFVGTAVWWIAKLLFKKKDKSPPENQPHPNGPTITMSLDDFQNKLDERETEVRKELETATAEQVEVLNNQLADVQRQRANPDKALQEAKERIISLEQLLEREGNDIGGERLAKARAALEAGDYSIADEIFAEIEARADLEVQSAARAAFGRGEIAKAEIRWLDAATHYSKAAQLDPTYDNLSEAGEFLRQAGQYKQAVRVQEELLELAKQEYGDQHVKTAKAMNGLALNYQAIGDYSAAEPLFRQASSIAEKKLGADHPDYATALNNLAALLYAKGDHAAAESLYRQALTIGGKKLDPDHSGDATSLNNLALLLYSKGDLEGAEPLYRQALAINEKTLGPAHPAHAAHLNNLAQLLYAKGDLAGAEPLLREAVSIVEKAVGPEHPNSKNARAGLEKLLRDKP